MKKECLSCRNAFRFYDGECDCFLEPEVYGGKRMKDNDCCGDYVAVVGEAYDERVACEHWLENNKEFLENVEIK